MRHESSGLGKGVRNVLAMASVITMAVLSALGPEPHSNTETPYDVTGVVAASNPRPQSDGRIRSFDLTENKSFQSAVPIDHRYGDGLQTIGSQKDCQRTPIGVGKSVVNTIGLFTVVSPLNYIGRAKINEELGKYTKNNQLEKLQFAGLVLARDGESSLDHGVDAAVAAERYAQEAYDSAMRQNPDLKDVPAIVVGVEGRNDGVVSAVEELARASNSTIPGLYVTYAKNSHAFSPEDLEKLQKFSEENFVMVSVKAHSKSTIMNDCTFGPNGKMLTSKGA